MQFGDTVVRRVIRAENHGVSLVIDVSAPDRHTARKNTVNRRNHGVCASEILIEVDNRAVAVFFKMSTFTRKNSRVAPSEIVNILLYVAHHKQIIVGNSRKNVLLHAARILIFVGKNVLEP